MDGALGKRLVAGDREQGELPHPRLVRERLPPHLQPVRTIRTPADLKGIAIRVLPSKIQARTFELLGAKPMIMDLTDAIRMIKAARSTRRKTR